MIEFEEKTYFRVHDTFLESNSNAHVTGNYIVSMLRIWHELSQEVRWVAASISIYDLC